VLRARLLVEALVLAEELEEADAEDLKKPRDASVRVKAW